MNRQAFSKYTLRKGLCFIFKNKSRQEKIIIQCNKRALDSFGARILKCDLIYVR